jgi:hypothetical protein
MSLHTKNDRAEEWLATECRCPLACLGPCGNPRVHNTSLPHARAANQAIVRFDVYELLGATEVRDLAAAVKKVPQYYRASRRAAVSVNAEETLSSTA